MSSIDFANRKGELIWLQLFPALRGWPSPAPECPSLSFTVYLCSQKETKHLCFSDSWFCGYVRTTSYMPCAQGSSQKILGASLIFPIYYFWKSRTSSIFVRWGERRTSSFVSATQSLPKLAAEFQIIFKTKPLLRSQPCRSKAVQMWLICILQPAEFGFSPLSLLLQRTCTDAS